MFDMTGQLTGQAAVVTGAGSGIGAAITKAFCHEGARVLAVDISGDQNAVAEELGEKCIPFKADVTQPDDVRAMLEEARASFGGLDVLCNNVGIDGQQVPLTEGSLTEYERVMAVNARSVFLGMHFAIPMLIERGGGSIVNMSSIAALVAFPNLAPYCASKAAVIALTKTAAAEYGSANVRVNSICPGVIDTPLMKEAPPEVLAGATQMTPLGRVGQPQEIAEVAIFLASTRSSFLTGAVVTADGGYTLL